MSTSRNRAKDDSERTSGSNRRSAKSIGPRESITPQESPVHASSSKSLLYQCGKCNFILANSNNLLKNLTLNTDLLLFPADLENFFISTKDVQPATESEYDQFCVYNPVKCSNCSQVLGRYYLSITEKMALAKNALVIPEDNLLIYNVQTSRIMTPSGKKSKGQGDQTTAKKVVKTSVIKSGKEAKENKAPLSPMEDEKIDPKSAKAKEREREFSPEVGNREERKLNFDKKNSGVVVKENVVKEKDEKQIKEVEASFNELKAVLMNFAKLLESFDRRLTGTETTINLVNKAVSEICNSLNVAECIDLTE